MGRSTTRPGAARYVRYVAMKEFDIWLLVLVSFVGLSLFIESRSKGRRPAMGFCSYVHDGLRAGRAGRMAFLMIEPGHLS
jgi:hypothetical protein